MSWHIRFVTKSYTNKGSVRFLHAIGLITYSEDERGIERTILFRLLSTQRMR